MQDLARDEYDHQTQKAFPAAFKKPLRVYESGKIKPFARYNTNQLWQAQLYDSEQHPPNAQSSYGNNLFFEHNTS